MMAWVPSLRSALRGTPHFDAVLALIAFAALLIDPLASHQVTSLTPLDGGLALVTAVPLVLRRRYPLGVLVSVVPLLLVCLAVFHPDHAAAGIVVVVVFSVGLHGHRARALGVPGAPPGRWHWRGAGKAGRRHWRGARLAGHARARRRTGRQLRGGTADGGRLADPGLD